MNDTRRPRRALRRVGAVLAGMLVIVILSIVTDLVLHVTGVFPPPGQPMANGLWLLATFYRIVYGVAGCYLTARLAPDRPMAHAMVLGLIGTAVGVAGTVATWGRGPGFGPTWYPITVAAIPIPCAWLGVKLHGMPSRDRAPA